MIKLYLLRHAPAIHPSGLIYGHSDYPADVSNVDALRAAISEIPSRAHLYSSDLLRCRMTAEVLVRSRPDLRGPIYDSEFREQNFGEFEGQRRDCVAPTAKTSFWLFDRSFRPPGGESFDDLVSRATNRIQKLRVDYPGGTIAVVTHGNFIRAAVAHFLKLEGESPSAIEVSNCGFVEVDFEHEMSVSMRSADA